MTTTTARPAAPTTTTLRYSSQTSNVLLVAFAGSAAYTVYVTVAGLPTAGFSATDPISWVFYAIGFGLAFAVRTDRTAAWWAAAALLPVLLAICVLVYPASFVPQLQTTVGWLENDGYTGLLMLALYLTVQRLRRATLAA